LQSDVPDLGDATDAVSSTLGDFDSIFSRTGQSTVADVVADGQDQLSGLSTEVDNLGLSTGEDIAQLQSDVSDLAGAFDDVSSTLGDFDSIFSRTGQSTVADVVADGLDQLSGLSAEVDNLGLSTGEDIAQLQQDVGLLAGDLAEVADSVDSVVSQVNSIAGSMTSLQSAVAGLTSRVGSVESAVASLQVMMSTKDQQITDLQRAVCDLQPAGKPIADQPAFCQAR